TSRVPLIQCPNLSATSWSRFGMALVLGVQSSSRINSSAYHLAFSVISNMRSEMCRSIGGLLFGALRTSDGPVLVGRSRARRSGQRAATHSQSSLAADPSATDTPLPDG